MIVCCPGDDAVAMHGTYYIVASTDASKKIVILATEVAFLLDPGDGLTFYKANSERLGGAKISKCPLWISLERQMEKTAKRPAD